MPAADSQSDFSAGLVDDLDLVPVLVRAVIKPRLHFVANPIGVGKRVDLAHVVDSAYLNGIDEHVQNFEVRLDGFGVGRILRLCGKRRGANCERK